MTDAPCAACGSAEVRERLSVREMMFGLEERFDYAVCAQCASLRLLDVPGDLSPYYPDNYYSVDLDPEKALGAPGVRQFAALVGRSRVFGGDRLAGAAVSLIRRRQFRTLMSILGSVRLAGLPAGRRSRVLDVGCGSGMLVYALALAGVRTSVGVDPFAPGDRVFDNGSRLMRRDLGEVEGTYDLVMFHHSLEHVLDPSLTLRQAKALLAPGGRVLIRMPTVSSEAFETYGPEWVQLDAPRHTNVVSREGMAQLAAATGFAVAATADDSTSFQFWGSEQVRAGISLGSGRSHMVDPKASIFTSSQIAAWDRTAAELNTRSRGDQSVWVLAPAESQG